MTEIEWIADGLEVMRALERVPEWRELGFPVVDRGRHAIFPLAVAPLAAGTLAEAPRAAPLTSAPLAAGAAPREVRRLATVSDRLTRDCIHLYGGDFFHAESPVDLDAGYGRRIVDSCTLLGNPPRLIWWRIGKLAVILVHAIDAEGTSETMALHVTPKEWVHHLPPSTKRAASRARRMLREQAAADASWVWPMEE